MLFEICSDVAGWVGFFFFKLILLVAWKSIVPPPIDNKVYEESKLYNFVLL